MTLSSFEISLLEENNDINVINLNMPPRIKIPWFDNSEIIRSLDKTLIGRIMNPEIQNIESLLLTMPQIWNLEEQVRGKDLGLGLFKFDFVSEEDLLKVLKSQPLSFDDWMVSLVRWEPVIDEKYPSVVTFWVRVLGVPLGFRSDEFFGWIGNELGMVKEVDVDNERVKVDIDGSEPLRFEVSVSFETDCEDVVVRFEYEKLVGYCRSCFSLCHDEESCPNEE